MYTDKELAALALVARMPQRERISNLRAAKVAGDILLRLPIGQEVRLNAVEAYRGSRTGSIPNGKKRVRAILEASGVKIKGGNGRYDPVIAVRVG